MKHYLDLFEFPAVSNGSTSFNAHEAPTGFAARDSSAADNLLALADRTLTDEPQIPQASGCGQLTEAVHLLAPRLPNQETYRSMDATSCKRESPLACRPPFSNDAGRNSHVATADRR
jgi:hypothetical protein